MVSQVAFLPSLGVISLAGSLFFSWNKSGLKVWCSKRWLQQGRQAGGKVGLEPFDSKISRSCGNLAWATDLISWYSSARASFSPLQHVVRQSVGQNRAAEGREGTVCDRGVKLRRERACLIVASPAGGDAQRSAEECGGGGACVEGQGGSC